MTMEKVYEEMYTKQKNSMGMLVIMTIQVAVRAMQNSISKVFVNFLRLIKIPIVHVSKRGLFICHQQAVDFPTLSND